MFLPPRVRSTRPKCRHAQRTDIPQDDEYDKQAIRPSHLYLAQNDRRTKRGGLRQAEKMACGGSTGIFRRTDRDKSVAKGATHRHFSVATDVTFASLSDEEIEFYVTRFKPFDKAGAYGIQEWIGYIGVTSLNGSYYNVMGLPVQRIWKELNALKQ